MSFDDCKNWPSYCVPVTCTGADGSLPCFSTVENDGPRDHRQQITTDYAITVAGVRIPIVLTNRTWETHDYVKLSVPTAINGVYLSQGGVFWCFDSFTPVERVYRVSEDCQITRSTLHYLDLRYGVCLYRKNVEMVQFDITTDKTNLFKNPWGTREFGRVALFGGDKQNWDSRCTEEWHLIIDGVDRVIATTAYDPLPEMRIFAEDGSNDLFDDDYPDKADPDLELIIHTNPPTSSDEIPWDDELRYHGFYSYRGAVNAPNWQPDGAGADYFYPAWCRSLQLDPFWQAAAERRFMLWFPEARLEANSTYTPPIGVTVDPLPVGTFVRHPVVGDVWQFLVGKRDGGYHLETSPNVDALVLDSLSKNGVTPLNGTMLYYPIGV